MEESLSADEQRILFEISQALHQSINLDDQLMYIVSKAKQLFASETVAVLLHDPSTDELFFRFTEGNPGKGAVKLQEIRFSAQDGIAGSVFQSGRPELIPDVSSDPRHYKTVDRVTRFRTRSMIVVPLQTRGRTIGVLEACNKIEGQFSEKDMRQLSIIANTLAMALENARIHAELAKAYQELQLIDKAKDNVIASAKEENAWLRREIEDRHRFEHIKGCSPQMLDVLRLCEKVIDTDITVLIQGETGTGKEIVARCIHYNGPRKGKRFVTQNCGGIPESLLASELFGHKKGAFTGAISDKKGLFEMANGGTVFLDEVAEMSPAMQVSLLRVLQEGEIKPLGADEARKVNVRIISATNRDLAEDVRKGGFREDLYYRLNVFTIQLPPLRERAGDIPLLANHFLRKFNQKMGKAIPGFSEKAMERLQAYSFPGNIRELENEVERAVALAEDGKRIEIWHLSEKIKKSASTPCLPTTRGTLRTMIEEMEKSIISRAVEELSGNKTKMAKQLGLSRFGLIKKMKRYGFRD